MVRFLHTSDWQIGMSRHYLDASGQARFDEARIDVIRTLGRVASSHGCAFIVVAGDVFETNFVGDTIIARVLDALREIPIPVFLLPGNHDFAGPGSVWDRPAFARHPEHVTVLDAAPVAPLPGVQVVGASWRSKRPATDLVADALDALPPHDGVRVLVGHGAVDRFAAGRSDPSIISEPAMAAALANGVVNYVALGDRHSTFEVLPGAWYSGAPEPTAFDEIDPGNVLVVDVEPGTPPSVTRVPVATWRFVELERELRAAGEVDALLAELDALPDRRQAIVRLVLSGVLPFADASRLRSGLDTREGLFAAIDCRETLLARPSAADIAALDVGGYLRDAVATLSAEVEGGSAGAAEAEEALILLYRLAGEAQ